MSLSYASNLGHIPPINGLYSFVFNPLIYALLGTCPQMVVGPEAAGSLLVGTVVRTSVDRGHSDDDDDLVNARIAGVVTGIAGAIIFIAGLSRLGFLDSVLSRPFLRGFISAIGFVILVDQLIPELGLGRLERHTAGVEHGSSVTKLIFLVENIKQSHALTAAVSLGAFAIIMVFRYVISPKLMPILTPLGASNAGCNHGIPQSPTFLIDSWSSFSLLSVRGHLVGTKKVSLSLETLKPLVATPFRSASHSDLII